MVFKEGTGSNMIFIIYLGHGVLMKSKHKTKKNALPSTQQIIMNVSVGEILGLDAITGENFSYTFKVTHS